MAGGEKTGVGTKAGGNSRVSGNGKSEETGEGPGLITRVAGGTERGSNGPSI